MHLLLKRQLRKYLPDSLKDHPDMAVFLDAISKSYSNHDEKLKMIQRATTISSQELYEANEMLRKDAESQKRILKSLSRAIASLDKNVPEEDSKAIEAIQGFDPIKLAKKIEAQADEILRMSSEKDELLKNLELRNESLNNYAHMVSHDLKSPIRNINALINWTVEDNPEVFSGNSKANFDLVLQNLTKMDALIDGILNHATIDTLAENVQDIDLNTIVTEITRTIYIPSHVQVSTLERLPNIRGEKYKIELLFKNLLTNAIAATEDKDKGEIHITATDKSEYWEFAITDNGKGIPEHHQKSIFNMFKKLENNAHATGIGLALVKKIVNAYQGDIWLISEEDKGATFFFTLKKERE